ncbi:MAG: hypothetical protein A2W91_08125 [Bacteroidetes bacterium GWF2_38_335]|nr:MAG: hypothetical protein A2W91_08125 [Bacteroidetes bacterium GWF2_38_335]OFY78989.1 MAG: hypothetical protein A2281_02595 [Bacteroidetes bacterium RIFOXYA12_FULL_38_20]HBS86060.1 hypothetical protein [Bacteroidales bacterium]
MTPKKTEHLTIADFEQYPIWEYVQTENLEEGLLVVPLQCSSEVFKKRLESIVVFESFYAKTKFITPKGKEFSGYSRISNHTKFFGIQPYSPKIFAEGKVIPFWFGRHFPDKNQLEEFFMALRINPGELFPLKLMVEPDIFHIQKTGEIKGFTAVDEKMKEIYLTI